MKQNDDSTPSPLIARTETDEWLWYGRELNRHAARANAAMQRIEDVDGALRAVVERLDVLDGLRVDGIDIGEQLHAIRKALDTDTEPPFSIFYELGRRNCGTEDAPDAAVTLSIGLSSRSADVLVEAAEARSIDRHALLELLLARVVEGLANPDSWQSDHARALLYVEAPSHEDAP